MGLSCNKAVLVYLFIIHGTTYGLTHYKATNTNILISICIPSTLPPAPGRRSDRRCRQFDDKAQRRRRHADQPNDKGAPDARHAERLRLVTLHRTVRRANASLHGVVRMGRCDLWVL